MAVNPKDPTQPDYNVYVKQLCDELQALKGRVNLLEDQSLRAPGAEVFSALPPVADRLGKILSFNPSTGDPEVSSPASGSATEVQNILTQAIQQSSYITGVDTGTANALDVDLSPAVAAVSDLAVFFIRAAAVSVAGAATLKINDLLPQPLVRPNGTNLKAGDIPAVGASLMVQRDAANSRYILLNPAVAEIVESGNSQQNFVLNSDFILRQRTDSSVWNVDCWASEYNILTQTVAWGAFTPAEQANVGGNRRYLRTTITVPSTADASYARTVQFIEDVQRLMGRTVRLTFWARSSVAGNKIGISFKLNTGGAGTGTINGVDPQTVTLGTSWQRYSLEFDLHNLIGAIIAENNCAILRFYYSAGALQAVNGAGIGSQSGQFDITGVQLFASAQDPGDQVPRAYVEELRLCQRYAVVEPIDLRGTATASGAYTFSQWHFPEWLYEAAAPAHVLLSASYTNCSGFTLLNATGSRTVTPVVTATAAGAVRVTGVLVAYSYIAASAD